MNKTGQLDSRERIVRVVAGIVLLLLALDYGFTVIGTGAVVLAVLAFGTAAAGKSPADRALARIVEQ